MHQRESQALLLMGWEDENEKEIYPQKVFEYLAARRPVFVTGGTNDEGVKKLITDTHTGVVATEIQDIARELESFYKEYLERGSVLYRGNPEKTEQYSYRTIAKLFAEILDKVLESRA